MYYEMKAEVKAFLKKNNINAYELRRITKDLCSCGSCKFYVQHYNKDGKQVDFGHCVYASIPKSTKPNLANCFLWTDCED